MFAVSRYVVAVIVFALFMPVHEARAQDSAEKGTVTGIVKDSEGNPAAGVQVQLFHPMDRPQRRPAGEGEKGGEKKSDAADKSDKADKAENKPARPTSVSSGVTDNEGKFTLSDVPVGKYVVRARMKQVGMARQDVEIKSGETATVELQLQQRKPKQ